MIRCYCHDIPFELGDDAWLKDDGTILCEDGHADECYDDPFDNFDHGTRHNAANLSILREGTIA